MDMNFAFEKRKYKKYMSSRLVSGEKSYRYLLMKLMFMARHLPFAV